MHTISTLVINWHLTEACNYKCRYCYAIWDKAHSTRELIGSLADAEALLGKLYRFFEPGNGANPLSHHMRWESVRLNLAGGEPLLHHRQLPHLVQAARALGFEVSLITNGSLLTENVLATLAPHITWLGISIDSASLETNRQIGRADGTGRLLDCGGLAEMLSTTRCSYPQLKLKLNTVVNKANVAEDLSPVLERLAPDKWKVLRMLPMVTDALAVSDDEFANFVTRHQSFAAILCAEGNHDMRESYLMVDPQGRFFQNGQQAADHAYTYSRPILEVGAAAAFSEISFDPGKFRTRYPEWEGGK